MCDNEAWHDFSPAALRGCCLLSLRKQTIIFAQEYTQESASQDCIGSTVDGVIGVVWRHAWLVRKSRPKAQRKPRRSSQKLAGTRLESPGLISHKKHVQWLVRKNTPKNNLPCGCCATRTPTCASVGTVAVVIYPRADSGLSLNEKDEQWRFHKS